MNKITINTEYTCKATMVSNIFIDRYMPEASGSFVKVYLYLLRCLSDNTKPNIAPKKINNSIKK